LPIFLASQIAAPVIFQGSPSQIYEVTPPIAGFYRVGWETLAVLGVGRLQQR
jgi:hypothetical protein